MLGFMGVFHLDGRELGAGRVVDMRGSVGYKVRVLSPFPAMEIYADY